MRACSYYTLIQCAIAANAKSWLQLNSFDFRANSSTSSNFEIGYCMYLLTYICICLLARMYAHMNTNAPACMCVCVCMHARLHKRKFNCEYLSFGKYLRKRLSLCVQCAACGTVWARTRRTSPASTLVCVCDCLGV